MIRIVGIDYGAKRVGLAIADDQQRIASPLATLETTRDRDRLIRRILDVIREWDARQIVIGLPLNMDGSEGPQAKLTRQFGAALARAAGLPVHFHDERLSSHAAEESLREADLSRGKRRARVDRVAAQIILQSHLDHTAAGGPDVTPPAAAD